MSSTRTDQPRIEQSYLQQIQERIEQKTKPLGALGQLEDTAKQLAYIASVKKQTWQTHISVNKPSMLVFAGDHGIAEEGISIAPSAVTRQMVLNFLAGGAAINCFCKVNDIQLNVIDAGIIEPIDSEHAFFTSARLGAGTHNFSQQAAMLPSDVKQGILNGGEIAQEVINQGCELLMFGEMGIGNTSSASAIFAALSGQNPEDIVGFGTGIEPQQLTKKLNLIEQGIARLTPNEKESPYAVLAQLGGYEIVQIVGAILSGTHMKTPMLIDGFIVSVAAYVATRIEPTCRDFMLFAHQSDEKGHQAVLSALNAEPLLNLGLRLGEGTGAALAYPLLKSACAFYNDMASFADAGVTV
ncbi:nicotinate-nucleotide--dimethylbenzimidazole phosphoribosyltransferase [Algibacillus agarilyticus]|uniref:nicotinate-nucleotide--dimethylbenzimidazole phosphoribosyltransferase n=1 Tax=Algibacillus agarilyticus TaxID=2234133 RepID=UPI000DCFD60F|nr:nicotinate-nucleotide--dimethylbenzimidazole phosphoribosyltransferase [Algibacillus agarilyticus]